MAEIHSYPKVWNLGHPALDGLRDGPVSVEEKVDGSQFSFGIIDGELCCRSKNQQLILDAPQMFDRAVESVQRRADRLTPGWAYRAEYLAKPKHNTLAYDRTPEDHLIVFDVEVARSDFLAPDDRDDEAARIGIESVPRMHYGELDSLDLVDELLSRDAALGGCKVEGIVVKNHARFGRDGKALMGKHVSEAFKEKHAKDWKKANPNSGDIIQSLVDQYQNEVRWEKAVQHLRDDGVLEGGPRDIGALVRAAQSDLAEECEDEIKEALWKWARAKVTRGAVRGLPEWYKRRLLESEFDAA